MQPCQPHEPCNERFADISPEQVDEWLAAEEAAKGARYADALASVAEHGLPRGMPS